MKTRDDILSLALHDPIVMNCVTRYQRGDCTWEEAMMQCVFIMSEQNKNQFDMLVELQSKKPHIAFPLSEIIK